MADKKYLESDKDLEIIAYHSIPRYKATITLTRDLNLIITMDNSSCSSAAWFGYKVGYRISKYDEATQSSSEIIETKSTDNNFNFSGNSPKVTVSFSNTKKITNESFPIKLDLLCQGCDHNGCVLDSNGNHTVTGSNAHVNLVDWEYNEGGYNGGYIIYDNRHTHIDPPKAPTIISTTGKTITVSGDNKVKEGQTGTSYDSPHTFTGYGQGTSHTFYAEKSCPDCPDNKVYTSFPNGITGKTWSITGESTKQTTKTLTFKAIHTAGTGGSASEKTITYKLYTDSTCTGTVIASINGNNKSEIIFTGLTPNTQYYCKAYTTGITDNTIIILGKTLKPFTVNENSFLGDVSAKTLRTSLSWTANGSTEIVCTFSCNGVNESSTVSGNYVGFTELTPGNTYDVQYNITDAEDNTASGTISLTTKKTTIGEVSVTSKIIRYSSYSNYSNDTMQQKIESGTYADIAQNTNVVYNNLIHNTIYKIYARIKDCYAFDTSGTVTTINDSEISTNVTTYELTLSGSISEEHQHSIVTLWQAKVNGTNRDNDAIDGTLFTFSSMKTEAKKESGYQQSEVTEGVNGNTTGNYQTDHKVYSNNLTWYYCKYIVTVEISDGYNKVSASVIVHTTFPYTWIYSDGRWHKAMGYIYTENKFVPAPCFVYKNGSYIEPNGE